MITFDSMWTSKLANTRPWVVFVSGIMLLIATDIMSSVRNPHGIPDGSPWNIVDLAATILGFILSALSPLLTSRSITNKFTLAIAASFAYIATMMGLSLISLYLWGLPVQS